jgi:hypothetical protein
VFKSLDWAEQVKMGNFKAIVGLICLMAVMGINGQSVEENDFFVSGKVYCDTCHCGFITEASHYIPGARVAVRCMDEADNQIFYREEKTDDNGVFRIRVNGDHAQDSCVAEALSSPTGCNTHAYTNVGPVYLTHNNGIRSNERWTGPFGFKSNEVLAVCQSVMKQYTMLDETAV